MNLTHGNSSILVPAPNKFPPDPGEKLNWKTHVNESSQASRKNQVEVLRTRSHIMTIAEESDGDASDDQSCSSEIGIIDSICPPPNKVYIVNQLRTPWSSEQRNKKATKQETNQGCQISALGKNQVEVWNSRKSQEQAVHQGATSQESDQIDPMIDISDNNKDERSRTSAEW